MDTELDRLLERSRRGDPDGWRALVDRLEAVVYSVPRRFYLGEDDASDVFISTFEALHRNLNRLESGRSLPKWVATTAARESLRILRLRNETADVPLDDIVAAEDRDAEEEAVKSDSAFRVRDCLSRMSRPCRDLLAALYDEETTYQNVADRLSLPLGAIGPTRARCLEKLRRMLKSEGFFD